MLTGADLVPGLLSLVRATLDDGLTTARPDRLDRPEEEDPDE